MSKSIESFTSYSGQRHTPLRAKFLRLWKHRLFLKNGENAHGFLKQFNTGLQVHPEIFKDPVKTFLKKSILDNI
jgi:hypothetical protein